MTPSMKQRTDVQQGTLALMVLKTLDVLGLLHGYGIAKRIEQISGGLLSVNQGTLYRCCCDSSRRERSSQIGARRRITAVRVITV
jgi:hypothetical protein